MKICPKCNSTHTKPGTFCSRKCANSREFSDAAKLKKSIATKEAIKRGVYKHSQEYDRSYIYTDEYRNRQSIKLKEVYKENPTLVENLRRVNTSKIVSASTREKLRANAIKNNFGGHTSKTKLYYECVDKTIVYLQSSYEVQLAKSLDANNIRWERPLPINWTSDNGLVHKYYPDFYLIEYDVYMDTKNDYLIIKDSKKIECVRTQNNIKLLVVDKNNLDWCFIQKMLE